MESTKSGTLLNQSKFPYITEVSTYSPSIGASTSTICFQIHDEAFQGRGTQYLNWSLYATTLDNPYNANKKEVIVKFVL